MPVAATTRVGAWTVVLAAVASGGTVALAVAFAAVLEPADGFTDNRLVDAAGLSILLSAVGCLVAGVVAVVRRHDRSWAVLTATAVGGVVTAVTVLQVAEGLGWLTS
ncbi:hypothetical protein ASG94_14595 [Nocardioides sp. Soil805]|nr:hypothetical protein ASG94_14595 [Nocardioides sp. Soil805]